MPGILKTIILPKHLASVKAEIALCCRQLRLLYSGKRGVGILVQSEFDFEDIWCGEEKDINTRKCSTVHIRIQAMVRKLLNKQTKIIIMSDETKRFLNNC